jgi:Zn-dependent protease with chaperone function
MSALVEGWALLAGNAFECAAVASVQIFTIMAALTMAASWGRQFLLTCSWRGKWAEAPDHSRVRRVFERAVSRTAMRHVPAVRIGDDVPGACTIGFWRPDVCVSPALADSLDDDELEAVLLHELAHADRRDVLGSSLLLFGTWIGVSLVAAGSVLALEQGHPGTMRTRLLMVSALIAFAVIRFAVSVPGRFLRELTCDDLAVRWSGDPLALASALTKVSRLDAPAKAAAMSSIGHRDAFTMKRIERLIDYRPAKVRLVLQRAAATTTLAALAALAVM